MPELEMKPIRSVTFEPMKVYLIHTDRSPDGFVAMAIARDGSVVLESGKDENRKSKYPGFYSDDSTVTGPFNSIPAAVGHRRGKVGA